MAAVLIAGCAGAGRREPSSHSAKPGRGIKSRGEKIAEAREEVPPPPEFLPPVERAVGRIALVHEAGEFVLIEASGAPRLAAGTELEVRSGDGSGIRRSVRVSPERRPGFLVADFDDGQSPRVGDEVVLVIRRGGPTLDDGPPTLELPPLEPPPMDLPSLDSP